MNEEHSRRSFLKHASLLPFCAAATVAGELPAAARPPIPRIGGVSLKVSLNAYSFSKLLNDQNKGRGKGITLFDLLDFCAKHNFDGVDPTGYFFPTYPAVPPDDYVNNFKRRALYVLPNKDPQVSRARSSRPPDHSICIRLVRKRSSH